MFVAPFTNDIALRNSYDYDDVNFIRKIFVKNILDQLLLHTDIPFANQFVLKTLLDCESTDLMKSWIMTRTDDDPDTIFDLVNAIIKISGLDSIICSMSEPNLITVIIKHCGLDSIIISTPHALS
jgi:hypothetical protein